MSTRQDRFAAFVDVLAAHLDDHQARAADLAARLHLSLFHFSRIVASAGGETPARFRRRVLLERAAYRLLTCDQTVLDVGVEAGHSSHEAFSRVLGSRARVTSTLPVTLFAPFPPQKNHSQIHKH